MKVLLIQPPVRDFYQTSIRTQPIGLAYLASSLKSQGHEVEILDCQTPEKRSIPVPFELSYLQEFYPFNDRSPFKLYSGYYHFGMGWDEVRERLADSKADVVGISSSFTPYHGEAVEVARIVKEWDSKKIVIMGGAHVSCDPNEVLKSPFVDYVVLGEGEIRFLFLLEQIEKEGRKGLEEIDGIGFRVDGKIQINPIKAFIQDLDALPHPARELLDLDRYRISKKRSTMMITSRGCAHGCAYCSTHLVMGTSFRTRSPEAILQEMRICRERYGIQCFDFEDDNFTFDQQRAKQLMSLIIGTFGEETLELSAMNGISFASLDGELLRLMKQAGFHTINLSFVSTDLSTQERMKRPKAMMDFGHILEEVTQAGLHVIAYGIFGMPGQTTKEMVDTVIYLMGKRVLIGPSVYYPTPGTPLFKDCKVKGILPSNSSQWRSSALPIETKEFNRLDMATLFRLVRAINFIKGVINENGFKEGLILKEFFETLKEMKRIKTEDWMELLSLLFEERSFFSLRRGHKKRKLIVKEKSSKEVLDYFFKMAWERPILKGR